MNPLIAVFFALAILLSLYEFLGVLKARTRGVTKNTGRVVLRGIIFLSILVLLWQNWDWQQYIAGFTKESLADMRVGNIPFLISGFVVCLISLLIMFEIVSLARARRAGLTKNLSRLVTSFVIFFSLLPIMYETVRMWDRYMQKVETFIPFLQVSDMKEGKGMAMQKVQPCLWFDGKAEEAARFYVSVFKNAKLGRVAHYGEAGGDITKQKPGTVMTVEFELDGQTFLALNGGPAFKFNEAVSLMVMCRDQAEVDHYWEKLGQGGDPKAQRCGWLKDKYGLSWQIVPLEVPQLVSDPADPRSQRAMAAMLKMKKLDLAALRAAYEGN